MILCGWEVKARWQISFVNKHEAGRLKWCCDVSYLSTLVMCLTHKALFIIVLLTLTMYNFHLDLTSL